MVAASDSRPLRIVGLGGGTGLSTLLAGLRRFTEQRGGPALEITGVVSVADDGGSTGRLRRQLGIPAVGDLRNCLVALSSGGSLWHELFQHRFTDGEELGGHALGNLVMAALATRSGGLVAAVDQIAGPLGLRGRVLPVTEQWVQLCAELDSGELVRGESAIPRSGRRIRRVLLCPERAPAASGVLEALYGADAIVIGPGSLYTSLLPNLLVDGVAEAIRGARGLRIFACNLMTQPGETEGLDADAHLRALLEHVGAGAIDVCLMNGKPPRPEVLARYAEEGARPIVADSRRVTALGVLPVTVDLLADDRRLHRHDADALAEIVVSLARSLRRLPRPTRPAAVEPAPVAARAAVVELPITAGIAGGIE
jgi:uncharacterized cofD-like protein